MSNVVSSLNQNEVMWLFLEDHSKDSYLEPRINPNITSLTFYMDCLENPFLKLVKLKHIELKFKSENYS
jgi:hypothetical protein